MGRFSTSSARLHELRWQEPANAAFSGSATAKPRPLVRSRASPTRHPASLPEISPPWTLTLSGGLPCPQRSGGRTPPRRPRGALPASSPWNPTGRMPAQAPRGCCPGRTAARRTRDIPIEFRATPALRRQFGGDAGPRGPSRIRRSAPRPGHIGRQAEQGGLASAADRRNPGKGPAALQGPAEAFAGTEDSRRQIAASMPHASGSTDRRPRPHMSKRPRKRP